jgi:hypothetical protein
MLQEPFRVRHHLVAYQGPQEGGGVGAEITVEAAVSNSGPRLLTVSLRSESDATIPLALPKLQLDPEIKASEVYAELNRQLGEQGWQLS